ncbi:hypothetical protein [Glaesserella parasuis]|uniref:hypothetical protein n=1 Tax=Glaesserella parasuis TaxID=738 RepID=UPI0024369D77|nr:hypothetical protein [Glaesserella parasuis]MDG6300581.1 hypothetical protein [Glaesserella parasuis]MDG6855552.1 hypothetical protein [Glaesserella parasuis]
MKPNKNHFWAVVSILAVALLVFSIEALFHRYKTEGAWNTATSVFTILGVLITVGTVVPAVLSYQSFIRESDNAKKELDNLRVEFSRHQRKIEQLSEREEQIIQTVTSRKDEQLIENIALNNSVDLDNYEDLECSLKRNKRKQILAELAELYLEKFLVFKYCLDDGELTERGNDKYFSSWLKEIKIYQQLSADSYKFQQKHIISLSHLLLELDKMNRNSKQEDIFIQAKLLFADIKDFPQISLFNKQYSVVAAAKQRFSKS